MPRCFAFRLVAVPRFLAFIMATNFCPCRQANYETIHIQTDSWSSNLTFIHVE
jgi:hypothetical protein